MYLLTFAASLLDGVFLIAAFYCGCSLIPAAIFFTLSIGAHGVQNYCLLNNAFDLNANYATKLIELMSGLGSILGFLVSVAVGQLVTNVSWLAN